MACAPPEPSFNVSEPVVITGYAQISSLGTTLAELDDAIRHVRSGVSAFSLDLPGIDRAEVAVSRVMWDSSRATAPSKVPMDRGTALALRVTEDAITQAAIDRPVEAPHRLGVYWGSGMAGAHTFDQSCFALYEQHRRMRPTNVVSIMPNAPAAEIALSLRAQGACLSFACACASSAVALGEALHAIRSGRLDWAVVGGSESMLTPGVIASWQAMRVMAPAGENPALACKPFDANRNGFALGEGAAALVLESRQHALQRGARPLAILSGYGTSSDGVHITNPDQGGQVRAMRAALQDANLSPGDIGYINAHGTATHAGDITEAHSIGEVFGERKVPVSSTKALHGHLLGAGGALELVIALRSLATHELPVAANLTEQDPRISLKLVRPGEAHAPHLKHVMSNAFAFGGTNAVLIASAFSE
jgi:3-oxoacyl-[acyl-carrier-protein] synthase II